MKPEVDVVDETLTSHGDEVAEPPPHLDAFAEDQSHALDQVGGTTAVEDGVADVYNQPELSIQSLAIKYQRLSENNEWLNNLLYQKESEIRNLSKMKDAFEQLQAEALSSVDRFQAAFDETITDSHFKVLDQKVKLLVSCIIKLNTALSPDDQPNEVIPFMWHHCLNADAGSINFNDKEIRRKALRSVVWKFLEGHLFHRPFMCFGGETAKNLDDIFTALFPAPSKADEHEL